MPMTLTVHCQDCDRTWDHTTEPGQTLYGAAYVIGARHEGEYAGERCAFAAAHCIELVKAVTT